VYSALYAGFLAQLECTFLEWRPVGLRGSCSAHIEGLCCVVICVTTVFAQSSWQDVRRSLCVCWLRKQLWSFAYLPCWMRQIYNSLPAVRQLFAGCVLLTSWLDVGSVRCTCLPANVNLGYIHDRSVDISVWCFAEGDIVPAAVLDTFRADSKVGQAQGSHAWIMII
jgi:hypothetical protein